MPAALLLVLALTAQPAPRYTVIVGPEGMRSAMVPWTQHRIAQGHAIRGVTSDGTAENVRARIAAAVPPGSLESVVLLGDVPIVPTFYPAAKVNVHFGSESTIASDNPYGDFDADGIPEVAVGRLPADSPAELSRMMGKILKYETSVDLSSWRRRINFIAGVGGMGALADMAMEAATKSILCESIPAAYATTMTYASWQSPYCPAPSLFRDATLARLNEGCLFWVYLGHGHWRHVDAVQVPQGAHPILSCTDASQIRSTSGAPVALFLACYTGAFDAPQDCLAEEMLRTPAGPVAVISGSRVTMPYAMAVLGTEMLEELFAHQRETLGEIVVNAKRNSMLKPRDDARSRILDGVARMLNPAKTDLADERAEHVLLFNLLGDPLLRLRHPAEADVHVSGNARRGGTLQVRVHSPIAEGQATVELVVRRDRLTFAAESRSTYDPSPLGQVAYQQQYERAIDARLASAELDFEGKTFNVSLPVPDDANGPCHVRVYVHGKENFAIGSTDIAIE
jgi:hypothetical protein